MMPCQCSFSIQKTVCPVCTGKNRACARSLVKNGFHAVPSYGFIFPSLLGIRSFSGGLYVRNTDTGYWNKPPPFSSGIGLPVFFPIVLQLSMINSTCLPWSLLPAVRPPFLFCHGDYFSGSFPGRHMQSLHDIGARGTLLFFLALLVRSMILPIRCCEDSQRGNKPIRTFGKISGITVILRNFFFPGCFPVHWKSPPYMPWKSHAVLHLACF